MSYGGNMAYANGSSNGGSTVLVLYKIANSESDREDGHYNAFQMPRGPAPTLAGVKQSCVALHSLNHMGPDGYHWRVLVEDKPLPGSTGRTYTWWDIQDENAKLPVKETTQSDLQKLLSPRPVEVDSGSFQPKNALKNLGKAMNQVVAGHSETGNTGDYGPPVSVIAFKLLDLVKAHDDFARKGGGHVEHAPAAPRAPRQPRATAPQPPPRAHIPHAHSAATHRPPPPQMAARNQSVPPVHARAPPPPAQAPRPPAPPAAEPSLMSFDSPAVPRKTFNHSASMPLSFDKPAPKLNETRAERLQREYSQKNKTANRVWDDVDQRWVEVDGKSGVTRSTTSAPPGSVQSGIPQKKAVGIKLDAASAVGKSASVQAAVHQRVNDMRQSQAKALQEVREREHRKKVADAEEDAVRKKLEPKIKVWSEEHGKKKQLRALLGSLHTILWPEADWKPVNIGDILDDGKCKRCFHKASRVVHPDKAQHLDAEKRFLAKRIFDALSQAKSEFDG